MKFDPHVSRCSRWQGFSTAHARLHRILYSFDFGKLYIAQLVIDPFYTADVDIQDDVARLRIDCDGPTWAFSGHALRRVDEAVAMVVPTALRGDGVTGAAGDRDRLPSGGDRRTLAASAALSRSAIILWCGDKRASGKRTSGLDHSLPHQACWNGSY